MVIKSSDRNIHLIQPAVWIEYVPTSLSRMSVLLSINHLPAVCIYSSSKSGIFWRVLSSFTEDKTCSLIRHDVSFMMMKKHVFAIFSHTQALFRNIVSCFILTTQAAAFLLTTSLLSGNFLNDFHVDYNDSTSFISYIAACQQHIFYSHRSCTFYV